MSCIVVLGLPRSGTSAVAGILHHLGLFMGNELMNPLPGVNDKGFFEDMEFVRLHNVLLDKFDPLWAQRDGLAGKTSAFQEWKQLIRRRDEEHAVWGVKDPKLCFLFDLFAAELSEPPKVVLLQRPFIESVQSYSKLWNGMPLDVAAGRLGRYQFAMETCMKRVKPDVVLPIWWHGTIDPSRCLVQTEDLAELMGIKYSDATAPLLKTAAGFIERKLSRHSKPLLEE